MKRTLGVIFMSLGLAIGLASLFVGVSVVFDQVVYRGLAGITANLTSDIFFLLLASVFIFLAVRVGTVHEKRVLAILFFIGSILLLALSINTLIGFANSIPLPSKEWLTNMAWSRAYILNEYPVVDDGLITQGRIALSGSALITLILSAILAWLGKAGLKTRTTLET
jgi:hypothetical protein